MNVFTVEKPKRTAQWTIGKTATFDAGEFEVPDGKRGVGLMVHVAGNAKRDSTTVLPDAAGPFGFEPAQQEALLKVMTLDAKYGVKRNPYKQAGFDRVRDLARSAMGFAQDVGGWLTGFGLQMPLGAPAGTLYPWAFDLWVPLGYCWAFAAHPLVKLLGMGKSQLLDLRLQLAGTTPGRLPAWTGNTAGTGPLIDNAATVEVRVITVPDESDEFSYVPELWDDEFSGSSGKLTAEVGIPFQVAIRDNPLSGTPIDKYTLTVGESELVTEMTPAEAAQLRAMPDPVAGQVGRVDDVATVLYEVRPGLELKQIPPGRVKIEWKGVTQPFGSTDVNFQVFGLPSVPESEVQADLQRLVDKVIQKPRAGVNAWRPGDVPPAWLASSPILLPTVGSGASAVRAYLETRPNGGKPKAVVPEAVKRDFKSKQQAADAASNVALAAAAKAAVLGTVPGASTHEEGTNADTDARQQVLQQLQ